MGCPETCLLAGHGVRLVHTGCVPRAWLVSWGLPGRELQSYLLNGMTAAGQAYLAGVTAAAA